MSVYSPVGGWTRWIYYFFPNLIILHENYASSASFFILYIPRWAPFPSLQFKTILCIIFISIKISNSPQTKQEPNKSPYLISNRFVAALLFWKFPLFRFMWEKWKITPPHWWRPMQESSLEISTSWVKASSCEEQSTAATHIFLLFDQKEKKLRRTSEWSKTDNGGRISRT